MYKDKQTPKQIFLNSSKRVQTLFINFGPQHPAAHGVLRIILELLGEVILKTDIHIGLLHRGSEKLIENKVYLHSIPHFDRMDYVSTTTQESAFCLAVENLIQHKFSKNLITLTRTVIDELTRILNHYLALACHALDVGSMSPLFWAFEERESIMSFYEYLSGARMHTALYRPTTINKIISKDLSRKICLFLKNSYKVLNDMHSTLTHNKIWISRLRNNMLLTPKMALKYGLTGVLIRSCGIKYDLRVLKKTSYNLYPFLNINSFVSIRGDSLERYLLRIYEMIESFRLVNSLLYKQNYTNLFKITTLKFSMESVINHFKMWSTGFLIKSNILIHSVESPKGDFGVSIISDNSNKPYRCKVRSPSYYNLQYLSKAVVNYQIPDLVTMIGTLDIVLGEIDR